jgi:hypothetical protein
MIKRGGQVKLKILWVFGVWGSFCREIFGEFYGFLEILNEIFCG